ncbi:MAG: hypothetical protein F6K28_28825 [Microcoleus sp. SIO2G3]|nr:hypothetical protein [Microcoleus sp. SIO2G3]
MQAQNYFWRDRRQSAKTQSIQIAYERSDEAIQSDGLHKQFVLISCNRIEYLDCLIRSAYHLDCLAICIKRGDRIAKIAESRSMRGFQRLSQVVESVLKAPGCDRLSDTMIGNSNRG